MVHPSLSDPLVQDVAPRSARRKALAFAFCAGFGYALFFWGGPQQESEESAFNMAGLQFMQPTRAGLPVPFRSIQPEKASIDHIKDFKPVPNLYASSARKSMQLRGLRSKFTNLLSIFGRAKYPGTDVEIDATGVTFPIEAVCEVSVLGKGCDGAETPEGVSGVVNFVQTDAKTVAIDYEIKGLTPGLHGFHVHEKADFSNGCASAGPHYNPFKKWHGGPDDKERHVGDLGNIEASADGIAKGSMKDKLIKLFGEYTVVERSMMVHADPDDLGRGPLEGFPEVPPPAAPAQHTKTTGNAGARIGCGVIKLK